MNVTQLAEQFWEQGYLVLDGFFEPELMDNYQADILNHFGKDPEFLHNEAFLEKSKTDVIPWFPQLDGNKQFDLVEQNSDLAALTQEVLGDDWSRLYCMVMFSKQGSLGQAWHQDCPPEESARFNLNRLVYTMDIDDQTGGKTVVVPGSHKLGPITVGEVNETLPNEVILSPKKGTLVLLHGHTWHRVEPVSGAYRASTNYRCCPAETPEDVTDICVYRNMRYCFSKSMVVETRS